MGLLSFLFGLKPAANKEQSGNPATASPPPQLEVVEPDFRTPDWIVRKAFDQVMASVEVAPEVRAALFDAYSQAHRNGDPRAEEKAVASLLANTGWRWREFDEWAARFAAAKEWPYMWYRYEDFSEPAPSAPTTAREAVARMTVSEMRLLAKEKDLTVTPAPRKRAQFESLLVEGVPLPELLARVQTRLGDEVARYNARREEAKCKLLAHTLTMTAYSTRDAEQRKVLPGSEYRVEVIGSGCPVEERFAAMYNLGKIGGAPPFFPGDRNCTIYRRRESSER